MTTIKQRERGLSQRNGENRSCLICGNEFYAKRCEIKIGKGKYCSRKCVEISRKGKPCHPNILKANIGRIPPNKGKKMSPALYEKCRKTMFKKGDLHGVQYKEGHIPWTKGRKTSNDFLNNNVNAYKSLHKRINRRFIKTGVCEKCNTPKKTLWASRDHLYLEPREYWMELCQSCHSIYDKVNTIKG